MILYHCKTNVVWAKRFWCINSRIWYSSAERLKRELWPKNMHSKSAVSHDDQLRQQSRRLCLCCNFGRRLKGSYEGSSPEPSAVWWNKISLVEKVATRCMGWNVTLVLYKSHFSFNTTWYSSIISGILLHFIGLGSDEEALLAVFKADKLPLTLQYTRCYTQFPLWDKVIAPVTGSSFKFVYSHVLIQPIRTLLEPLLSVLCKDVSLSCQWQPIAWYG